MVKLIPILLLALLGCQPMPLTAAFGDSLTVGWANSAGQWVSNFGLGSEFAAEGRDRLISYVIGGCDGHEAMVLMWCTNDVVEGDPVACADAVHQAVDWATECGPALVMVPPYFTRPKRGVPASVINARIDVVAEELAPLEPLDLRTILGIEHMGPDGVHPTAEGYALIARHVELAVWHLAQ